MKEAKRNFLLRIDSNVLHAVQKWANSDLRSLNSQIEFLLRQAVRDSGNSGGELEAVGAASSGGVPVVAVEEDEEEVFRADDL